MGQESSTEELIGWWTLVGNDWQLVKTSPGAYTSWVRLLLKFFEREARFPARPEEMPLPAVASMAEQMKVDHIEFAAYPWAGRSAKYQRKQQIRGVFGFREFDVGDEVKLTGWLAAAVCPVALRDGQLRKAVLVWCPAERVEP